MMVLLTGGSKCGKSSYAERLVMRLAQNTAPKIYLATMQVRDQEDMHIVSRHQKARAGKGFIVIERERDVGGLSVDGDAVMLLEDVPNLLANEMFGGAGPGFALSGLETLKAQCAHFIVVTNELGSDGILYPSGTQAYIKELGNLNQALAAISDCVLEVVCGLPQILKGELP